MKKTTKAKPVVKAKKAVKKAIKKPSSKSRQPAINFIMSQELNKKILDLAKAQSTTKSNMVRILLEQALAA